MRGALRSHAHSVAPTTHTMDGLVGIHPIAGCSDVVEMRLQKPPVNTFDVPMMEAFISSVKALEADPAVQGLVLTSCSPKVFTAGLNFADLVNPSPADFKHFWSTMERMVATYYMSPLATVAAIGGSCPALGAVLSLASDYRVMVDADKSRFGLNETALGMVPPRWLMGICAQTIGPRKAELHLQNSTMLAPRAALEEGYLDELCTAEELLPTATAFAVRAAKIPAQARAQCKQDQRRAIAETCDQASVDRMAECVLDTEFQATLSAMLEAMQSRKKK